MEPLDDTLDKLMNTEELNEHMGININSSSIFINFISRYIFFYT